MTYVSILATQMPMSSWHDGGLFMGMHWVWWLTWGATVLVIGLAFGRLYMDRARTRRRVDSSSAAQADLRSQLTRGEIDEDEYSRRIKALRETLLNR